MYVTNDNITRNLKISFCLSMLLIWPILLLFLHAILLANPLDLHLLLPSLLLFFDVRTKISMDEVFN